MKDNSGNGPMKAFLYGLTQMLIADLYTFTLNDGTVLRYTSCDIDLTVGGLTYISSGPKFKKGNLKTPLGTEVADFQLTVYPSDSDMVEGITFLNAITNGLFDNATVSRLILCKTAWNDNSGGTIKSFTGRIADIVQKRDEVVFTIKALSDFLNMNFPKNVYQAACLHTLYDTGCTLLKANFLSASSISIVHDRSLMESATLTQASGYFELGKIDFTSGVNNGVERNIKAYSYISGTSQQFVLNYPLLNLPSIGDTFNIYAGCDKTKNTCNTKFNNLVNFRGFPFIPTPETAT